MAFLIKGCPRSQIFFLVFPLSEVEKHRIRYQDSDCTAICGTVWTITITRKLVKIDTKCRKSGQSDRLNGGVKETRCPKRADTYMRWCLRSSTFSEVPRSNEFSTRQSDD